MKGEESDSEAPCDRPAGLFHHDSSPGEPDGGDPEGSPGAAGEMSYYSGSDCEQVKVEETEFLSDYDDACEPPYSAPPSVPEARRRAARDTWTDSGSDSEEDGGEPAMKRPALNPPDLDAAPSLNILSQLELSLQREQGEPAAGLECAPRGDSDWEEEEAALFRRSKDDLIAEIKVLRAKLARSARETRRLRQSLTLCRVLPKAVKTFSRLVDRAESLLQDSGEDAPPTAPPLFPSPSSLSSPTSSASASPLQGSPASPPAPDRKWDTSAGPDWSAAAQTPYSQIRLEPGQIERLNRSTPQKFVNDLMQSLYSTEFMATHSVTGARSSSSKYRETKPAMDRAEVQAILDVTKHLFPDMTDTLIRRMMGQKLNNCTKKFAASRVKSEFYPLMNCPAESQEAEPSP
ncbi:BEN domain-containing protein 6 isoform X2 [Amia ocellicauda]|uniref:BEN domain-containing protein 6 isoform X2 n=1 Tax=Amia ocellicauda TaxID=2972642 RepID=UPI003464C0B8